MIQGEFELLKALHSVSQSFIPEPYAWGKYRKAELETLFFIVDFWAIGDQPHELLRFIARLVELRNKSLSPAGKFGFHITTWHGEVSQLIDCWEDLWEVLYRRQFSHMTKLDEQKHGNIARIPACVYIDIAECYPRLLRLLHSTAEASKLVLSTEICGMRVP